MKGPTIRVELSPSQKFLLKWLSQAEFSLLGECHGPELNVLVALGLAEISNPTFGDWTHVAITAAGRAELEDNP